MNQKIIQQQFDIDYPPGNEINEAYVGSIYDIYKKAFESGQKIGFTQGYICATANIMHTHGEDTIAEDVLRGCFMSEYKMQKAGVDKADIKVLKPIIKEIIRKQK